MYLTHCGISGSVVGLVVLVVVAVVVVVVAVMVAVHGCGAWVRCMGGVHG